MNCVVYRDLKIWKTCEQLAIGVHECTGKFPESEYDGLRANLRKASVAILTGIAEVFGRDNLDEKVNFLYYSRGSLYEVETQLLVSRGLELIQPDRADELAIRLDTCKRLLDGFITHYTGLQQSASIQQTGLSA